MIVDYVDIYIPHLGNPEYSKVNETFVFLSLYVRECYSLLSIVIQGDSSILTKRHNVVVKRCYKKLAGLALRGKIILLVELVLLTLYTGSILCMIALCACIFQEIASHPKLLLLVAVVQKSVESSMQWTGS